MLFGPAYKGIPLAAVTAVALHRDHGRDQKYCYNRKEAKDVRPLACQPDGLAEPSVAWGRWEVGGRPVGRANSDHRRRPHLR